MYSLRDVTLISQKQFLTAPHCAPAHKKSLMLLIDQLGAAGAVCPTCWGTLINHRLFCLQGPQRWASLGTISDSGAIPKAHSHAKEPSLPLQSPEKFHLASCSANKQSKQGFLLQPPSGCYQGWAQILLCECLLSRKCSPLLREEAMNEKSFFDLIQCRQA